MKEITGQIKSSILEHLKATGSKKNAITSKNLAQAIRIEFNKNFSDVNIRKVINEFRRNEIPVVASSLGYWISYDKEEVLHQIVSMRARINIQLEALKGLERCVSDLG